jgi:ribose 5-phosphate isomerase B
MVYLGSDHRGFQLKEKIKSWLKGQGVLLEDLSAAAFDPEDDYSDYGTKVGEAVSKNPDEHRGIVICGSGAGICVTANKFKGVRAALAFTPKMARAMRNDDDINILCLASDFTDGKTALEIVDVFLKTPFGKAERYQRRVEKLKKLEEQ